MIVEVVEYAYLPCFFEVGFSRALGSLGLIVAKTGLQNIGDFKKGRV